MITPNAIAAKVRHEREVNAPQWIKCSERMPDEYRHYWTTLENTYTGERVVCTKYFTADGFIKHEGFILLAWLDDHFIPEPYQGEA